MRLKSLVKIEGKRKYSEVCRKSELGCALTFVEISLTENEDQKSKSEMRVMKLDQNFCSLNKPTLFPDFSYQESLFKF